MAIKRYQHRTNGRNDTNTIIYNLRGNNRVVFENGILKGDINALNPRAKKFIQQRLASGIIEEKA